MDVGGYCLVGRSAKMRPSRKGACAPCLHLPLPLPACWSFICLPHHSFLTDGRCPRFLLVGRSRRFLAECWWWRPRGRGQTDIDRNSRHFHQSVHSSSNEVPLLRVDCSGSVHAHSKPWYLLNLPDLCIFRPLRALCVRRGGVTGCAPRCTSSSGGGSWPATGCTNGPVGGSMRARNRDTQAVHFGLWAGVQSLSPLRCARCRKSVPSNSRPKTGAVKMPAAQTPPPPAVT
jgi:hypothetical protein